MAIQVPLRNQLQHEFTSNVYTAVNGFDEEKLVSGDPAALAASIVEGFGLGNFEVGQNSPPEFETSEGQTRLIFKIPGDVERFEKYARTLGMSGWSIANDDKSLWISSIGGKTEKILGEQIEKKKTEIAAAIKSYNDEIAFAKKQILADVTGGLKKRQEALLSSDNTAVILEKMGLKRFKK